MKAVVYAAKSTEDRHGSIPTQTADCRALCERDGMEVVGEFQDEGFSAFHGNRGPGLKKAKALAVETAAAEGACALVVQHSDRLARGDGLRADHLAEIWFDLRREKVLLRSVQDDQNFEDPIRAVLIGERNTEDSKRKSESVKAGMQRRAERGKPNGGPPPYGYRWEAEVEGDRLVRRLVVVESEAAVVRRIFADYVAGGSQLGIARALNREGVRAKRGGDWRQGSVKVVLSNPLHKGFVHANGNEFAGDHEPTVSAETWDAAAKRRAAGTRSRGGGRGREPVGGHLFTKALRLECGFCGSAMVPRTVAARSKNGSAYTVYVCEKRIRAGADACPMGTVRREPVDSAVFDFFMSLALDVDATVASFADATNRKLATVEACRADAERELARAEARLDRVKRDYQDGRLDADDWREQRDELREQVEAAQANLGQTRRRESRASEAVGTVDAEAEALAWLGEIREAVGGAFTDGTSTATARAALAEVFERFVLRDVLNGPGPEIEDDELSFPGEHRDRDAYYNVEPILRTDVVVTPAVISDDDSGDFVEPVLRRVRLNRARNNSQSGRGT